MPEANQEADQPKAAARWAWVLAAIVVISAALRLAAASNDLWLDEIWTLTLAVQVANPIEIITDIHVDNNHFLNTAIMHWIGFRQLWLVYRIPCVVAGSLAVFIAACIGARRSRAAGLMCAVLIGLSYLQIHYASEARGYAYVVLFTLLSYWLWRIHTHKPRAVVGLLFAVSSALGILAHLTYLHFYAAVLLWSVIDMFRRRDGKLASAGHFAACHGLPLLCLAVLYTTNLRHMIVGGGPPYEVATILCRAAALSLGLSPVGPLPALAGVIFCGLLGIAAWTSRRQHGGEALVVLVAIVWPVVVVILFPPEVLFVRYFLVPITLFLILISYWLGQLWMAGRRTRIICGCCVALFACGNLYQVNKLIEFGRGNYLAAVQTMSSETRGAYITVGSDHDLRNQMLLGFWANYLPEGQFLVYVEPGMWTRNPPEWYIVHSLQRDPPAAAPWIEVRGLRFGLAQHFPSADLSGFHWFLYRSHQSSARGDPS